MVDRKTVARLIRSIIEKSPYTSTEVAQRSGFTQGTISKWVNDKSNINLIDFVRVCEACGVPNGVFNKKEMSREIPPAIAAQMDELINSLIDLHQRTGNSQNSPVELYMQNINYWLNNLKAMNQGEIIDFISLEDFVRQIGKDSMIMLYLPHRGSEKAEAVLKYKDYYSQTSFVSLDKGQDYIGPDDMRQLKRLILRVYELGENPFRYISMWRTTEENSYKLFFENREVDSLHHNPIDQIQDKSIISFWRSLVSETLGDKAKEFSF